MKTNHHTNNATQCKALDCTFEFTFKGRPEEMAGDDSQPRYLSTNIIAIRNV